MSPELRDRAFAVLPSQEASRRVLAGFGDVPHNPRANYRGVVCAIDTLVGTTAGRVTRRGFLVTPHPGLRGRAPLDVVAEDDGYAKIWRLIRRDLDTTR